MKRVTSRSVDDCFICKKSIPDSFSESSPRSIQRKRLVKSRKSVTAPSVEWIKCDTCKHWLHTQCCGLSNREFKKLSGDKQFFKRLVCCLKTLPSNCRTELLQSANRESDSTSVVPDAHQVSPDPNISKSVVGTPLTEIRGSALSTLSTLSADQMATYDFESPAVVTHCSRVVNSQQDSNQGSDLAIDVPTSSERERIIIVNNVPNPVEYCYSSRI